MSYYIMSCYVMSCYNMSCYVMSTYSGCNIQDVLDEIDKIMYNMRVDEDVIWDINR